MNSTENVNNYDDIDNDEIKKAKDEQIVRLGRNTTDYVYATSNGEELSINVARTMTMLDSQTEATDDVFYDICITEDELAEKINVRQKNLHQEITKGTFLEDLRTSAFVNKRINEKGEIEYADFINAMSRVTYENKKLYLRKNPDMQKFHLKLGKNNPYFEIFTKSANALPKHKQIELYKLIENELSRLQYELGMRTKVQMLNDHKWRELHVLIIKIRKNTFTLDTYLDNHKFISTFLKRQLETISEKTDIEIDYQNIYTNKKGDDAEYVIIRVRRKEISYSLPQEGEELVKYFEDDNINKHFIDYIKLIECDEKRIKHFIYRLKQCVDDTLHEKNEKINVDVAIRIIEYSARHGYRDFYPLKNEELYIINHKDDMSLLKTDVEGLNEIEGLYIKEVSRETSKKLPAAPTKESKEKLKEIERLHLAQVESSTEKDDSDDEHK